MEMQEWLLEMSDVVKEAASKAQNCQKGYYDQLAKNLRVLSPGDKVLVLLPSSANKFKLEWAGPHYVSRQLNDVDYEVETPGRHREEIVHINLLKKWNDPQKALFAATETKVEQSEGGESSGELSGESDDQDEPLNCNLSSLSPQRWILTLLSPNLDASQRNELCLLISQFPSVHRVDVVRPCECVSLMVTHRNFK